LFSHQEESTMMRPLAAAIAALVGLGALALPALAQPQHKNLQVLPKDIPQKQLKELMKAQAKALGVECDFCHDTDDFAKDTERKKTGRWMLTLTQDINKKFGGKQMVTCGTCHNGHEMPALGGPDLEREKEKAKAAPKK
jgi:hypothetical protein